MSTELTTIDTELALRPEAEQRIAKIESVLSQLNDAEQLSRVRYAVLVAKARRLLAQLLDDSVLTAMRDLIACDGDKTGMVADRQTYELLQRDNAKLQKLLIAAFVEGLFPVGNEINFLAGNVYATKEAYERKLYEAGIEYQIELGADEEVGRADRRSFAASVSYRYRGREGRLEWFKTDRGDFRIVTKYNKTDGPDTLRGKAESKVLRQLYKHCTGRLVLEDQDGLELDGQVVQTSAPMIEAARSDSDNGQAVDDAEQTWNGYIAECESLDQIEQVLVNIKKSRSLPDQVRTNLMENAQTKRRLLARRQ
jgi:hypothetical protein